MKYQILKNYGPGYHSRTQSPDGSFRVLCDTHISLDAAKSACRERARRDLEWNQPHHAVGFWEGK